MLASGLVYWKSARQSMVTTLTTEAEFINLTPTGLSLMWIANLVKQMNGQQKLPLLLYTDSRNAREVTLNKNNQARTRHIDLRYKWIIQRHICRHGQRPV